MGCVRGLFGWQTQSYFSEGRGMNIYYQLLGGHIHMRVFINGAKCGDLCCRENEFQQFQSCFGTKVNWIKEGSENGK